MNKYWYTKEVNGDFSEVIERTIEELNIEWFGVLTQINLKEKFKEKLWKDFTDYMILWACNPAIAYDILQNEIEIGLLLPCNIIIYKKNNKVLVSSIVPSVAMSFIENPAMEEFTNFVEQKLKKVIDSL